MRPLFGPIKYSHDVNLSAVSMMQGSRCLLSGHGCLQGAANELVRCPRCCLRALKSGSNFQLNLMLSVVHR
jgi:hypothetical protein